MIKVENIHKSFGNLEVLKGVSLDVEARRVVSIVGASGAGKTTLLQIMGTLMRPDSGKVYLGDVDLFSLKSSEIDYVRNRKIGFVFQFHNLFPEFSAIENICIPAFIAGVPKSKAEAKARELLSFFNLLPRADHKPSQLSGGEQQRIAVARALVNDPDVIFADEPSGNLDTRNKEELHQLFFKLRDEFNKTIVVVTHDEHLAQMSDERIEIRDGLILS